MRDAEPESRRRSDDLERAKRDSERTERRQSEVQAELTALRNRLIDVKAELKKSDYGQKQQELQEMEHTIQLLADNSADWRRIINGLRRWETDETATDYVSNRALQLIDDFARGEVTEETCGELRNHLKAAMDNISEELAETAVSIRETTKELREKEEALEDMNNDRKPYPRELKEARQQLQSALSDRYGRTIHVHILADLFDVTDEKWKECGGRPSGTPEEEHDHRAGLCAGCREDLPEDEALRGDGSDQQCRAEA